MTGTINVVVPTLNGYELTASCLRHLAAQTIAHRVIVVDNGSTDGTPERLRREWPQVTLIETELQRRYTTAVNAGVAAGDGEFIVLLNNDVDLRPDCLEQLIAPLKADPQVGSVAAVMLRPGEQAIDSVGVTADATLASFARLQGLSPDHAGDALPVLAGPEGTAGAYRRTAWEQVGGLDERIAAYMEVLDVALRLRAAGWRAAVAVGAVGVHLGSASYGRRSRLQRELSGFSRGYLLRRYGVLRGAAGVRAVATELLVCAADAAVSRDLASLRSRVAGWRAARGLPRHSGVPRDAIDHSIGFRESMALRRGALRPR